MVKIRYLALSLAALLCGCAQQSSQIESHHTAIPLPNDSQPLPVVSAAEQQTAHSVQIDQSTIDTEQAAAQTDLWDRIRDGMSLQHHSHPRLDKQIDWYSGNQTYIDRVSQRGERYLYHIVEALEENDMPLELALLPVVESAFDPFAYSHSHAAGLWQFIPGTGKRFGLDRNWWYDGRRDPVASTEAAIKYLSYLHSYFDGDWLLALAAYNSGEGNVKRAIARNRRSGKPTDFWSLKLPKETKAYVPQLLALATIVADPDNHQISLPEIADTPYFDVVTLDEQANLARIAEMAAIETDEIYRLNAGYNRWVTHPDGPQQLYVPIGSLDTLKSALASTPKSHWVPIKEYVVKKGDNLSTIARRHNVSSRQLKTTNQLNSDLLRIGQRLKIPGTGLDHPVGSTASTYTVTSGDSLWSIARKNNIRLRDLARWNNLDTRTPLQPGQILKLNTRSSPSHMASTKKVRYRVRAGDSLSRIASKFDLNIKQIVKWNKLNPDRYLQPGQRLTLFVDIRNI